MNLKLQDRPAILPTPTADPYEIDDGPLYASAKRIFQQSVSGTYRRIKWALLVATLGIYYFLPFVRWDRGPDAPGQAVLIDMPNQRFYFFFIEIWPQEVYYFTGLLILAALALFLMNALAGRVWCGYLCPQTVWTDLFLAVERLFEGDRRAQVKLEAAPWSFDKLWRRAGKHTVWLMIAWWTGGAWVLYFADAPTLVWQLATFQAPFVAWLWIGILTMTTYLLAGHMREQVCLYMCPWPRIQAALTDEWALNVTYKHDRGEPRMSLKAANRAKAAGQPAGDCVDCGQCVAVCPTGVDIREGSQLGCIQCGLCIDACDTVMLKIGREPRLIGYDNDLNLDRRRQGLPEVYKLVRPRTAIYAGAIALVGAIMLYALASRSTTELAVLHDRNPVFVTLSSGDIRNAYTIRLINKQTLERRFALAVEGLPEARVEVVGIAERDGEGRAVIAAPRDATRELRVLVSAPRARLEAKSQTISFVLSELPAGDVRVTTDHFIGP